MNILFSSLYYKISEKIIYFFNSIYYKISEKKKYFNIFNIMYEIKTYKNELEQNKIELFDDYFFIGIDYYKKKNYVLMKKYFLMAIDKGNLKSMFNLGWFYQEIEKDYDNMEKY